MGASISYAPLSKCYVKGANSAIVNSLEIVFGKSPWTLDHKAIPILHAMAAAYLREPNPYSELAHALYQYDGKLFVEVEW